AAARLDENDRKWNPLVEAALRDTLAKTYVLLEQGKEGQRQARLSVNLRKNALGDNDPLTLQSLDTLGDALEQLASPEAVDVFRDCLRRRENVLGDARPETLATLRKLGYNQFRNGEKA